MDATAIGEPRIAVGRSMLVAGLRQCHPIKDTDRQIPRQWRRLWPYLGSLPHQIGTAAYGVVCSAGSAKKADYMCAVEVDDFSDLPPELDCMRIPEQTYAVFSHDGHMSDLEKARQTIVDEWCPQSGHQAASTPEIERYAETFDHASGKGEVEIWIPLKS